MIKNLIEIKISFLYFKQIFNADPALDGKLMDFEVFQSCLGLFIFYLRLISMKFCFLNQISSLSIKLVFIVVLNSSVFAWSNFVNNLH